MPAYSRTSVTALTNSSTAPFRAPQIGAWGPAAPDYQWPSQRICPRASIGCPETASAESGAWENAVPYAVDLLPALEDTPARLQARALWAAVRCDHAARRSPIRHRALGTGWRWCSREMPGLERHFRGTPSRCAPSVLGARSYRVHVGLGHPGAGAHVVVHDPSGLFLEGVEDVDPAQWTLSHTGHGDDGAVALVASSPPLIPWGKPR